MAEQTAIKADRGSGARPERIESDIVNIRSRINSTLAEIEQRLRPDNLAGTAMDAVRSMVEGKPHPVGDAVRRNPVPLVLAGVGLIWLALEVARGQRDSKQLTLEGDGISSGPAEIIADLIGVARQGTKAMRQAGMRLPEGPAHTALRIAAEERGRTAALLQAELQRMGIPAVHGDAPTGDVVSAWTRVEELIPGGDEATILNAVDLAEEETLRRFRQALKEDLPEDLRIVLGGRFYEVERTHDRLHALRQAIA